MSVSDKTAGLLLLCIASGVFAYYTFWVFFLPFIEHSQPIQKYFPDRYYALAVPAGLLVTALGVGGAFVGTVIVKQKRRKAKAA